MPAVERTLQGYREYMTSQRPHSAVACWDRSNHEQPSMIDALALTLIGDRGGFSNSENPLQLLLL